MRVLGYTRVSGKGQVDGDGPKRQRDAIEAFCSVHKLEIDPADIYFEPISGTIEGLDRPELTKMLIRIEHLREAGIEVAGIVVEQLSRLARDLMVSELLLKEFRNRKLKVFCCDQGQLVDVTADGGDPTRVLIRQLMGALEQWEKSMLVRKLKLAKDRIRAETGHCEGPKPFGSRVFENECLRVIKMLAEQNLGAEEIARQLNVTGFRTRKGSFWTRQYVFKTIKRQNIKYKSQWKEYPE